MARWRRTGRCPLRDRPPAADSTACRRSRSRNCRARRAWRERAREMEIGGRNGVEPAEAWIVALAGTGRRLPEQPGAPWNADRWPRTNPFPSGQGDLERGELEPRKHRDGSGKAQCMDRLHAWNGEAGRVNLAVIESLPNGDDIGAEQPGVGI